MIIKIIVRLLYKSKHRSDMKWGSIWQWLIWCGIRIAICTSLCLPLLRITPRNTCFQRLCSLEKQNVVILSIVTNYWINILRIESHFIINQWFEYWLIHSQLLEFSSYPKFSNLFSCECNQISAYIRDLCFDYDELNIMQIHIICDNMTSFSLYNSTLINVRHIQAKQALHRFDANLIKTTIKLNWNMDSNKIRLQLNITQWSLIENHLTWVFANYNYHWFPLYCQISKPINYSLIRLSILSHIFALIT